jgi:twinkle protein
MSDNDTVIDFPRNRLPGFYSLSDLPQRPSIESSCFRLADWPEFDELFRLYLGQFIVVTGIAGHGKSTFMMNVLVQLARRIGMRSFMYVPENEGHVSYKLRLIWNDNRSFDHYAATQCFIQSAVPHEYEEPAHTIEWVLDRAAHAVKVEGIDIVYIDPWNEIERAKPRDMLLTDYIGYCLMLMKQFCRALNAIVIVVAHPTKAVNENGGRIPTMADIEGSMNWFNKADNGLVIQRDKDSNTSRVFSTKVREIGAGRLGVCHFMVDPKTGIFTPQYGAVSP